MRAAALLVLAALAPVAPALAQTDAELLDAAQAFPPMPREPADLIGTFVPPAAYTFGSGTPYNDLEYTLFDTSYMEGETNGFDTFMPVDPGDVFPGTGDVRLVRGVNNLDLEAAYAGPVGDRVILGIPEAPVFFQRGPDGVDDDYAVIQNVDYRAPMLQLRGSSADYGLVYATLADGVQTEGHYVFYTAGGTPDLVAFVWPCDELGLPISGTPPQNPELLCNASRRLSLTDGLTVRYAEALPSAPAVPGALAQVGTPGREIVGDAAVDADGNVYLVGAADGPLGGSGTGEHRVFVAQVRPDGSRGWTAEVPLRDGSLLFDAAVDADYVYAAGRTLGALPGFTNAGRWDAIVLKLDRATGALVDADQYGEAGIDGYGNVVLDGAGGLYVSGAGAPPGAAGTDPDYLVAKYDAATLERVWTVLEPPAEQGPVFVAEAWGGLSVAPAGGGRPARLLAGGWYMGPGGAAGFLSLYEDLDASAPTRVATATVQSPGQEADWVLGNAIGPDGRLYAAGYTTGRLGAAALGDGDAWVAVFSPDLTAPEYVQLGTSRSDMFRTLAFADGALYAAGYTYGDAAGPNVDASGATGDAWAVKLSPDLDTLAQTQFGTPGEDRGFGAPGSGPGAGSGGVFVVGGLTEGALAAPGAGSFDAFAVALDPADLSIVMAVSAETRPDAAPALRVYPNPSTGSLTLSESVEAWVVVDSLGRTVFSGERAHQLDVSALPPGAYSLRADGATIRFVRR